MNRRPRRNQTPAFKAKVVPAAIKGDRDRRVGRHVSLLSKVNSQKPPYTIFLTPSESDAWYPCFSPESHEIGHCRRTQTYDFDR